MSQVFDTKVCLCEDEDNTCCCDKNCCTTCCGTDECCKTGKCTDENGCCTTGSCHIEALKKIGKERCDTMDCNRCCDTK